MRTEATRGAWVGATLALALATGFAASAHQGATGVVKERMDAMSEMGKAAKAISRQIKGTGGLDPVEIGTLAAAITAHAEAIPRLFPDTPASRHGGKTEALPAIWEKREEFDALGRRLQRESAALADAAAAGEASLVTQHFSAVRETCRDCHDGYRKKKSR